MAAEPRSLISREAYLALERESDERHEYIAGEVFAMAGGTETHALIIGNLIAALHGPTRLFFLELVDRKDSAGDLRQ